MKGLSYLTNIAQGSVENVQAVPRKFKATLKFNIASKQDSVVCQTQRHLLKKCYHKDWILLTQERFLWEAVGNKAIKFGVPYRLNFNDSLRSDQLLKNNHVECS
jgi:hypothetical protein